MNNIQTGDVYQWWEKKHGRPYSIKDLSQRNLCDDYLQNWLNLLKEKTVDEVQATCTTHLRDRTIPLTSDNIRLVRQEILDMMITIFQQTVHHAIFEDPIGKSFYGKWSPSRQKEFNEQALDIKEKRLIYCKITQFLLSELEKNEPTFWQKVGYCFNIST